MAKNVLKAKPLFVKLSSHANNKTNSATENYNLFLNKTNSRQNPNLQTYKINGVKVRLTARAARTLKKNA